ncbi:MAG: hypothetical protein PHI63_00890 [Patescibacteria group bacterium]|nr:hypothetical protein [Patescibacteria group bacterium]
MPETTFGEPKDEEALSELSREIRELGQYQCSPAWVLRQLQHTVEAGRILGTSCQFLFWRLRDPRQGRAMADALGPFYTPPIPDLSIRPLDKDAVHTCILRMRECGGRRLLPIPSTYDFVDVQASTPSAVDCTLAQALADSLVGWLDDRDIKSDEIALLMGDVEEVAYQPLQPKLPASPSNLWQQNLRQLLQALAFAVYFDDAGLREGIAAALTLWRESGNPLAGFNKEGAYVFFHCSGHIQ